MAMETQASLFTPPTLLASKSPFATIPRAFMLTSSTSQRSNSANIRVSTMDEKTEALTGFTPPQLDPNIPSPIFGDSIDRLLCKVQVEEFYVIMWESPREQVFEMPMSEAAIMRWGLNLLKLAWKEQCLALGSKL